MGDFPLERVKLRCRPQSVEQRLRFRVLQEFVVGATCVHCCTIGCDCSRTSSDCSDGSRTNCVNLQKVLNGYGFMDFLQICKGQIILKLPYKHLLRDSCKISFQNPTCVDVQGYAKTLKHSLNSSEFLKAKSKFGIRYGEPNHDWSVQLCAHFLFSWKEPLTSQTVNPPGEKQVRQVETTSE